MKHLLFFLCFFALTACQTPDENPLKETLPVTNLSGSITIDGTELTYFSKGSGQPMVVLGFPEYFSENLEDHFQLFFFDTRATAENYSPINPDEYTIETLLTDLDSLRSAAGLQNFIMTGHSIMGIIAYEYAKRYPEQVTHVVMLCSPSTYATDDYQTATREYWEAAPPERKALLKEKQQQISGTLEQLSPREALVKSVVAESPMRWHDPNFDDSPILEKVSYNMDFMGHLFGTLFANYNMFGPDEAPELPVFVATGKSDYVCPPTLWLGKYDDLPNLTISLFEKSGHTPQLEEPELLRERLVAWVETTYPVGQILTPQGEMLFWLHDETPIHKKSFIQLAKENYWDTLTFNRVVEGFVIQGGCPDTPEGFGDSPYLLAPEFVDSLKHVYGAVGAGRDGNPEKLSAGCQFYIVHDPDGIPRLDGNYTIFGQVFKGFDVLDAIATTPTDSTDAPLTPVPLDVNIVELTKKELMELGYRGEK